MDYVTPSAMPEDQYAKFDYGRLINWDDRLKREWPFFDELLGGAPSRRILDLGSGTGEHARCYTYPRRRDIHQLLTHKNCTF